MAQLQRLLCSLFCLVPRRVLRKPELSQWPLRGSEPRPVPLLSEPQGQSRETAPGATIPSLLWAAATYTSHVLGNSGFVSPQNLVSPMRASVATRVVSSVYSLHKEGPFVGYYGKEEQQALHAHKAPAAPAPSLLHQQPGWADSEWLLFLSTLASICGGIMCSENQ